MRIQRLAHQESRAPGITENMNRLDALLESYTEKRGSIIPILQGAQEILGYLPPEAFEKIAQKTGIKISDLYGVATFYAQFRLKPVGKHMIRVCHGTACHVQNANDISQALCEALEIKDGETTTDLLFTLESVACLGCCSLAPVMMVSGHTYGKLTKVEAVKIINDIRMLDGQGSSAD